MVDVVLGNLTGIMKKDERSEMLNLIVGLIIIATVIKLAHRPRVINNYYVVKP